ncbi:nitrite reductase (NAD(P)H) small subunit family protein [Salinicola sp. DM10]|uniref:nitrite reductase (NAD(P)H) small subunit family protein n=1 Tax=Salinicola sp. DM10 TaxID=2815721 RepID=UPI001A8FDBD4|nr:nitrite reductase (NAD(P)H) small subunit family protein [Salinicola sp. DM10]MCE3026556.1 nitrite reductase (NAD(P)H) small subunit family protein [Salinicola sp. DM10]
MSLSTLAASPTAQRSLPHCVRLCTRADLVAHSGVVAWYAGHQIAIFYLPGRPDAADRSRQPEDAAGLSSRPDAADDRSRQPEDAAGDCLYAVDNRDPFSGANVIGRGIIGELQGERVVASPLYKQHFRLRDGVCLEHPEQRLQTWPVALRGDDVVLLEADTRS